MRKTIISLAIFIFVTGCVPYKSSTIKSSNKFGVVIEGNSLSAAGKLAAKECSKHQKSPQYNSNELGTGLSVTRIFRFQCL